MFCMVFRYEYHWADGKTVKRPIKCSAPKYVDYLMSWVQDQLDDETMFPSKIGKSGLIFLHQTYTGVSRKTGSVEHVLIPCR